MTYITEIFSRKKTTLKNSRIFLRLEAKTQLESNERDRQIKYIKYQYFFSENFSNIECINNI